jgi:hypothetical protein
MPFDRSFLQLSNGIRLVVPSTDSKPELTAKASMAQPVSQPAVYASGLKEGSRVRQKHSCLGIVLIAAIVTTCFGHAWPSSGHNVDVVHK